MRRRLRRIRRHRVPGMRMLDALGSVALWFGLALIALSTLAALIMVLYLLKSHMGIDFFPHRHMPDVIRHWFR